jgi:hypothetical protein
MGRESELKEIQGLSHLLVPLIESASVGVLVLAKECGSGFWGEETDLARSPSEAGYMGQVNRPEVL